jgi:hypothetical protein
MGEAYLMILSVRWERWQLTEVSAYDYWANQKVLLDEVIGDFRLCCY